MIKPQKITETHYDYYEVMSYIKEKYKINIRDFWEWIFEKYKFQCEMDHGRDNGYFYLDTKSNENWTEKSHSLYIRNILCLIDKEFVSDRSDVIEFCRVSEVMCKDIL